MITFTNVPQAFVAIAMSSLNITDRIVDPLDTRKGAPPLELCTAASSSCRVLAPLPPTSMRSMPFNRVALTPCVGECQACTSIFNVSMPALPSKDTSVPTSMALLACSSS